jgi:hypothetical protein
MYGTTDIIVGTVTGDNSIENTDFNTRGEYEGGPDGCAVDFETAASGFQIVGNTFYRSFGAGLMVFGHSSTSHNFTISDNAFLSAGCVQTAGDRAGVAFMCPNGNTPSGRLERNTFLNCPGVPAIYSNPHVKGCADDVQQADNRIVNATPTVQDLNPQVAMAMPQINIRPPAPSSTKASVSAAITADSATPGAVLRYTTDGSRPSSTSPIVPTPKGALFDWPGPNFAFNVRAFPPASGEGSDLLPSVTNGAIVERSKYRPRADSGSPSASVDRPLRSAFDGVGKSGSGYVASGWVVDPALLGGGLAPVEVVVQVNYVTVATAIASRNRTDLVPHDAPNPEHGFSVPFQMPAGAGGSASSKVVVEVMGVINRTKDGIIGSGGGDPAYRVRLTGSPKCICGGETCLC